MVDILDEAIEEVKQEKFQKTLRKYMPMVLSAMLAVLIVVFAYGWWNTYQRNKVYKEGGEYLVAALKAQGGDVDKMAEALDQLAKGSTAYAKVAALRKASIEASRGDNKAAIEDYKIASSSNSPKPLRDYARLALVMSQVHTKDISNEDAIRELEDQAKNSIFSFSALEALAGIHMDNKDYDKALVALQKILAESGAPKKISHRATEMVRYINERRK
jgi:hypothetical protein